MQRMRNTISIPVIVLTLEIYSLVCYAQVNSISPVNPLSDSDFDFERPQDLNLGKRVYGYLTEYKRYPVYNFGLGKRSSRLYNFGLGKRSTLDEGSDSFDEYDEYSYNEGDERIPELELYHDDDIQNVEKRHKLYSFGLGKRLHRYDFGLGKRGQIQRYDFGLGKRSQPILNRDKLYNFGLGKRNRLYSFGLGKRPYNQNPAIGRFNFGLGKRSEDFEISKNIIAKREIHEENPPEVEVQKNNQVVDSSQAPMSKLEKLGNNSEPESHEFMGHPEKSQLSKRSPYMYGVESGKPIFRPNSGFSRQFRKPLYSFGLGKRGPSLYSSPKNYRSSEN